MPSLFPGRRPCSLGKVLSQSQQNQISQIRGDLCMLLAVIYQPLIFVLRCTSCYNGSGLVLRPFIFAIRPYELAIRMMHQRYVILFAIADDCGRMIAFSSVSVAARFPQSVSRCNRRGSEIRHTGRRSTIDQFKLRRDVYFDPKWNLQSFDITKTFRPP